MSDQTRPMMLEQLRRLDPAQDLAVDDATVESALRQLSVRTDEINDASLRDPDFEITSGQSRNRPGRRWRRRTKLAVASGIAVLAATAVVVALVATTSSDGVEITGDGSPVVTDAARTLLSAWTADHPANAVPELVVADVRPTADGSFTALQNEAFLGGLVDLSPDAGTNGVLTTAVHWKNGLSAPADLLPPAAALEQSYDKRAVEPEVTPLVITAASATTTDLATTRGLAGVPAWRMEVQGTTTQLLVVAAKATLLETVGVTGTTTGHDLGGPETSTASVENVSVSVDERTVTAHFVGSSGPASEPCGEDYTAQIVENAAAAVIIIYRHPHKSASHILCNLIGADREVSIRLGSTWNGRPFLDFYTGQPVTVN